jgi:sRNA-binding protein
VIEDKRRVKVEGNGCGIVERKRTRRERERRKGDLSRRKEEERCTQRTRMVA